MKVALVYDRVNKWGGAERVLLALHELFPEAMLYTSVYNPQTAPWAKVFPKIETSFLQHLPLAATRHELYPYLMPLAFESFNFSGFDLVISVTSEAAKGVITQPGTFHLCYLLTPTRYLWSGAEVYFKNSILKLLAKPAVNYLKVWDKIAAFRPDKIISISREVKARTQKFYSLPSHVIYPPVDVKRFDQKTTNWKVRAPLEKNNIAWGEYYLVVSRLVSYKKISIAIDAFNQLKWPLVIVGAGGEEKNLKKSAQKNIYFTGIVSEQALPLYYQGCKAFVFPQNEDFGITAVEAQASGRPVIAYRGGGAIETVVEGKTGVFFDKQTANSLQTILENFDSTSYASRDCIQNATRFSKEKFLESFATLTKDLV